MNIPKIVLYSPEDNELNVENDLSASPLLNEITIEMPSCTSSFSPLPPPRSNSELRGLNSTKNGPFRNSDSSKTEFEDLNSVTEPEKKSSENNLVCGEKRTKYGDEKAKLWERNGLKKDCGSLLKATNDNSRLKDGSENEGKIVETEVKNPGEKTSLLDPELCPSSKTQRSYSADYAKTVEQDSANHSTSKYPTMGESLNHLANRVLQKNQRIQNEEKKSEMELILPSEPKKRRSFTDLLLEIPRKLSHASETDTGNIHPILKRTPANRKPRKQSTEVTKEKKEVEVNKSIRDCCFTFLSGVYGLLVVVLGAVVPISETFADNKKPYFFDIFYIYLFTGSSFFILYVYSFLLRHNKKTNGFKSALNRTWSKNFIRTWSFTSRSEKDVERSDSWYRRKITTDLGPHNPNGSFYLRLGAVGFGIGGMIHSGLQLGTHFQGIGGNSHCNSLIQAIKPLFHLIFTFSQLYFVFLNPKVCIHRYKTFARFGLMHMCGTNVCVWFRNIVVETLHEMHHGSDHHTNDHHIDKGYGHDHVPHNSSYNVFNNLSHIEENLHVKNITNETVSSNVVVKCYWNEMMGSVVNQAAPYLYPCSIEYSLICAGIMYVLWQQVGRGPKPILVRVNRKNEDKEGPERNNRMSVDCGSSSRGLFVGILLFVGAVITMVAFYVLVNKENMTITALTLVHLSEITIYILGVIATLAAAYRMRGLSFHPGHASVLENVLILISLTGVFIFCIFGILAGIFHTGNKLARILSIASNLMMMAQSIVQTVFMVVASELQAVAPKDVKKKPGREFVTFLILCNLSLWGINTFETQRSEHNPIQTDFYGHMAWAILTHTSVPLGIFYRFHSTVCLSNIWKNAWKNKKHT